MSLTISVRVKDGSGESVEVEGGTARVEAATPASASPELSHDSLFDLVQG